MWGQLLNFDPLNKFTKMIYCLAVFSDSKSRKLSITKKLTFIVTFNSLLEVINTNKKTRRVSKSMCTYACIRVYSSKALFLRLVAFIPVSETT